MTKELFPLNNRLITNAVYEGQFAFPNSRGNYGWGSGVYQACREIFGRTWSRNKDTQFIVFTIGRADPKVIQKFFNKIETKLELKERTEILPTKGKVVVVKVADFWKIHALRRQLFTILLRASLKYKGNVIEALETTQYSKETMPAVERFLAGYVNFNLKRVTGGWAKTFNSSEHINKYTYGYGYRKVKNPRGKSCEQKAMEILVK